jgi:hypothetical protein
MPGSNEVLWGLAAGLVEDKHNQNIEEAARQELEGKFDVYGGSHLSLFPKNLPRMQCGLVVHLRSEQITIVDSGSRFSNSLLGCFLHLSFPTPNFDGTLRGMSFERWRVDSAMQGTRCNG